MFESLSYYDVIGDDYVEIPSFFPLEWFKEGIYYVSEGLSAYSIPKEKFPKGLRKIYYHILEEKACIFDKELRCTGRTQFQVLDRGIFQRVQDLVEVGETFKITGHFFYFILRSTGDVNFYRIDRSIFWRGFLLGVILEERCR